MISLMTVFQFGSGFINPDDTSPYTGINPDDPTQVLSTFELFISNMIGVLTIVASLFFIIYFILGAIKWVVAGGDSGKVGKARDQIVMGVLGLIVVVAAYAVIGLVGTILGLNILRPAAEIFQLIPGGAPVQ